MKRDLLIANGYEDSTVFEDPSYDSAIIGVADGGNVIYDYDLMIEYLVQHTGASVDDAEMFISSQTMTSLERADEPKPIIMYRLED